MRTHFLIAQCFYFQVSSDLPLVFHFSIFFFFEGKKSSKQLASRASAKFCHLKVRYISSLLLCLMEFVVVCHTTTIYKKKIRGDRF